MSSCAEEVERGLLGIWPDCSRVADCPHSSNAALNLLSLPRWAVLREREGSYSLQHEIALNRANPVGIQTESLLGDSRVFVVLPETGWTQLS